MPPATCVAFCVGPAVWGPAVLVGIVAGIASALFVQAYVRLARLGAHPDLRLCLLALRVAYCRPLAGRGRRRAGRQGTICWLRGLSRQGPVWILADCFGLLFSHFGFSGRFLGLALACTTLPKPACSALRIPLCLY